MSPGSLSEKLHFFVATYTAESRVGSGGGNAREGEDIGVIEMTIDEALHGVIRGDIRDGKTIMLLHYAALHLFALKPAAQADDGLPRPG